MAKKLTLTNLQKTILAELAKSPLKDDFYWTGGTALAYFHLKHRLSYDIDLFSSRPINYQSVKKLVDAIARQTKLEKIDSRKIYDRWEFYLSNNQETRLDFAHFNYSNLKPLKIWQGVKVNSLEDMAADKTLALVDRHDPKDAFDIYYLMTAKGYSSDKLLKLVKQKFDSSFPASLFWSQCLLGAQELKTLSPFMLDNPSQQIKKIVDFFEKQSAQETKAEL